MQVTTLPYSAILNERTLSGRQVSPPVRGDKSKFAISGLDFWYGPNQTLYDINLSVNNRSVLALIGPSGCGKSTFLRILNRMNDLIDGTRHAGRILLDGKDIYRKDTDLVELRRRVGMVFQKSNPFPKS